MDPFQSDPNQPIGEPGQYPTLIRSIASVCVSVCVCLVHALTFESLDKKLYIFDTQERLQNI